MQEAIKCLEHTPSQLCFLFAQIILEGYPASPIWNKFQYSISINFILTLGDHHLGYNCVLLHIKDFLSHAGKHLSDFRLEDVQQLSPEVESEYAFVRQHHQDFVDEASHYQMSLNEEQNQLFHQMLDAMTSGHPNHASFFVEGKPGWGKTFAVRALASTLHSMDRIILIISSSAFCAKAYQHGRTAHHMFGIPMTNNEVGLHSHISPFSPHTDLIQEAFVIVWEELLMINNAAWECADKLCRQVQEQPHSFFSEILFIRLGDFHQVAPIVPGEGETSTLAASVKSSALWHHLHMFKLMTSIWCNTDPEYTAFVDAIESDTSGQWRTLPLLQHTCNIEDTIHFLFPLTILQDTQSCLQHAFLSPCNALVDKFNDKILDCLTGRFHKYLNASPPHQSHTIP